MRMVERGTSLKDFEILHDSLMQEFEVTVAFEPGYKIRQAWRGPQSPGIPECAFSGNGIDPNWLAVAVQKKTEKAHMARWETKGI